MTIPLMLQRCVEKFGPLTALQMKGPYNQYKKTTYNQLFDSVNKIGSYLVQNGVNKGDRVALLCENRPEWPLCYFGITNIGAVAVPFDPKLEPEEIFNLLENSGSSMIFVSESLLEKIDQIKSRLPGLTKVISIDKDLPKILSALPPATPTPCHPIVPDDIAAIIYTSGTTGAPKGVMLSHGNIMSNVVEVCPIFWMIAPGDNFLSVLPAYHTFAAIADMFASLYLGATTTYAESLKSYNLIQNMQETKVSILCGVPLLFNLFMDGIMREVEGKGPAAKMLFKILFSVSWLFKNFLRINAGRKLFKIVQDKFGGNIRFFVSGGAAIDPELLRKFDLMGFTIIQGYGLTETSPILAACRVEDNVLGSVGKALPGVELQISRPGPDGNGEIIARGPNIMKGYYKNKEATDEVIVDGWFHTGDLGRFDKDGNLYITGRCKDVIVLGSGINVYPDEVEFALSKSPFIKEVCVFGGTVKEGARKGTEEVRAAVHPDLERIKGEKPRTGKEETRKFIGEEIERLGKTLTDYKRVVKYFISDEELPKTATRKIKRFLVKERYKNG